MLPDTRKSDPKPVRNPRKRGSQTPLEKPSRGLQTSRIRQKIVQKSIFEPGNRNSEDFPGFPGNPPPGGLRTQESGKSTDLGKFQTRAGPDSIVPRLSTLFRAPECQTANKYFKSGAITKKHLPKPSRTKKQSRN